MSVSVCGVCVHTKRVFVHIFRKVPLYIKVVYLSCKLPWDVKFNDNGLLVHTQQTRTHIRIYEIRRRRNTNAHTHIGIRAAKRYTHSEPPTHTYIYVDFHLLRMYIYKKGRAVWTISDINIYTQDEYSIYTHYIHLNIIHIHAYIPYMRDINTHKEHNVCAR